MQDALLAFLAQDADGKRACSDCPALLPWRGMNQAPTADEMMAMLREEGLVELAEDFPADGDLFAAGMDSMAVMQLIVVAEERFGAVIGPEDAGRENLGTPAALADLIGRKRA